MSTHSTRCSNVADRRAARRSPATPSPKAQGLGVLRGARNRRPDHRPMFHFPADRLAGVKLVAKGVFSGSAAPADHGGSAASNHAAAMPQKKFFILASFRVQGACAHSPLEAVALTSYLPSLSFNRPPQPSFSRKRAVVRVAGIGHQLELRRRTARRGRGRPTATGKSPAHRPPPTFPALGRSTTISYTQSAESTTGRIVSVCGFSGTTTNACRFFRKIGPPAERQWAVDPTGVLMIKPSQLYVVTKSEST